MDCFETLLFVTSVQRVCITEYWLGETSAIKKEGRGPGNEIDKTIQCGGLFCNGKFFTFPTTCGQWHTIDCTFQVYFLNTQNENVRCQVMKQHVFKDVCEYEAFRGVNSSCNKWVIMIFLVQLMKITLLVIFENCSKITLHLLQFWQNFEISLVVKILN